MIFRDLLISDLQSLPADRKELERINNPLVYEWKRRQIADRERLLSQLDTQERIIIERILINREKASALRMETGLTVREIQSIKDEAINKLLYMRHGAAYRP